MANSYLMIIMFASIFILLTDDGYSKNSIFVHAYYCDNDYCNSEQFCCGENICCDYVNNTIWHFICYLISFIVFAFILWAVFQLIIGIISNMNNNTDKNERTKTDEKDGDIDDENGKFTLI
ncbi:hypothetical protein BLA29_008895 [Euroglyphus maynei]|uniref:Uncharacterized protein n=1 Tax=Euroglyphus maynei TaxID=6958 RepID=A0A1Y3BAV5_EURMA|nr:hypothetical protein BLA29_008895 [Euroglyphus maynei]